MIDYLFLFFTMGPNLGNMMKEALIVKTKSAQFGGWTRMDRAETRGQRVHRSW